MGDCAIGKFVFSRGPVTRSTDGWVAYLDVYAEGDTAKSVKQHTVAVSFDGTAQSFADELTRKVEKLADAGKAAAEASVDAGLVMVAKAYEEETKT